MDDKPFLHKHYLLFDDYNNKEETCDKCNRQIHGWAYNCERCNFWLHSACARQQLRPSILHPLHSEHLLTLYYDVIDFVCDKCFTLSRGHIYLCAYCNFKIDVLCAAQSTNDERVSLEKKESKRSGDRYQKIKEIKHFVHSRPLMGIFSYRKVKKEHYTCGWCEKHLSGMSYGCLNLYDNFWIHETCLSKMPTKLFGHPFHPSHPLYIQPAKSCCNACKEDIMREAYCCQKCEFSLHVLCSRLQPSLKHEIHEHGLTYFRIEPSDVADDVTYQCNMCHKNIAERSRENTFYRCVQCDLNFHFNCLKIPSSIVHEYHRHALTLVKGMIEDDFGEYYCDICEEEIKKKHHVYCCENCSYIAHIQCAIKKVYSKGLTPELTNQEETEKCNAESQNHDLERQIEHFAHGHLLNYYELIEKKEDLLCKACNLEIYGEAYGCESCKFYLHKTCARLSYEVLHPLHPQHPLKLFAGSESFICPECKDFSLGFTYVCYLCNFILDVKCATIATPDNESQRRKEMDRESKLCPFRQDHELFFFNYRLEPEEAYNCSICFLPILGPTYLCIRCGYYIHESCFGFPREIKLPLTHPEQPLRPGVINRFHFINCCLACRVPLCEYGIYYNCKTYEVNLHLSCANSLRRALHSEFHEHPLFYFGTDCQKLFQNAGETFEKPFGGVPFYRCITCNLNFHLECALVPHFVKSRCHMHPFTLKDYFVEDDLGEYYCDVCEEKRQPNHHIYFCEECRGFFVAHIECVLNNTEEGIGAGERPSSNLVIDFGNISW